MADSLGGNAKTIMFVNVGPASSNASESLSSLNFAKRCKLVQNTSSATVETAQIRLLKKQILAMKAQNAKAAQSAEVPTESSKKTMSEVQTGDSIDSKKSSNDEDEVGEMVSRKRSKPRKIGRRSSFIDPKFTMSAH